MTPTTPTRPVLRWHGGKWLLAPWIIGFFPRHRIYVEPFGGAASVLLRKPRAHAEVYNDLDATVVNVFRVLRDRDMADELARRLALTPYARAEFDLSYEPPADDIDLAHKTIVRSFMGFGSDSITRTCRTGFRAALTGGADAFPSREWGSFHQLVAVFTERLRGVLIEQRPAIELFDRTDGPDTLYFLDPPYILSTRSAMANGRAAVHGYTHEMTDDDHLQLLGRIREIDGMVVLSGYHHPLYDDALVGWGRFEREALADGARRRTEVLWINPACMAELEAEGQLARQLSLLESIDERSDRTLERLLEGAE